MAFVAGTISLVSVQSNAIQAVVSAPVATPPTVLPVFQQWYYSTNPAFVPGPSNIIPGATSLSLNTAGLVSLIPNTPYYFSVIFQDSTPVTPLTATSVTSAAYTTAPPSQNPNQFAQAPFLGQLDMKVGPTNVIACQVAAAQLTPFFAGQAVQIVNSPQGGLPQIVACTSDTGDVTNGVFGFVVYDIKSQSFAAGSRCEVARVGSTMFLYATGAINSGDQVVLDVTSPGSVQDITQSPVLPAGYSVVGWALDQATAYGQLIRVEIVSPSFKTT